MRATGSSGTATLEYFDHKFHKRFVNASESRVAKQINRNNFEKHKLVLDRSHLVQKIKRLKEIDGQNNQLYKKLLNVEAKVPRVCKADYGTQHGRNSARIFQPVTAGRNYQTLREVGKRGFSQTVLKVDNRVTPIKTNTLTQLSPIRSVGEGTPYSSRQGNHRSWVVSSPNKSVFFDSSYKVLPTLNLPVRQKCLRQITEKNLKLYQRLKETESTIQTQKIMRDNVEKEKIKARLSSYHENGKRRKDPLVTKLLAIDRSKRNFGESTRKMTDDARTMSHRSTEALLVTNSFDRLKAALDSSAEMPPSRDQIVIPATSSSSMLPPVKDEQESVKTIEIKEIPEIAQASKTADKKSGLQSPNEYEDGLQLVAHSKFGTKNPSKSSYRSQSVFVIDSMATDEVKRKVGKGINFQKLDKKKKVLVGHNQMVVVGPMHEPKGLSSSRITMNSQSRESLTPPKGTQVEDYQYITEANNATKGSHVTKKVMMPKLKQRQFTMISATTRNVRALEKQRSQSVTPYNQNEVNEVVVPVKVNNLKFEEL